MPTSNPLDILLTHDRWATEQILNSCTALTPEQFQQRFEMGLGSLHNTLLHMVLVIGRWGDLLESRSLRDMEDSTVRPVSELQAMVTEVYNSLAASAKAHPLEGLVSREREGKTYSFTRGAVLTHVTTHSMHHRAQCLNMLRQLGVKPLPKSSVIDWTMLGDPLR